MAAISKDKLAAMEVENGLTEDGLTYQQRLARISKVQKGEAWEIPKAPEPKRGTIESAPTRSKATPLNTHPLFGKRLLITPMMTMDKNRALYFDEPVGPHIEVEEVSAGAMMYGAADDVDRISADYKIIKRDPSREIMAKTSIPKSGQEISWEMGKELVPVVRGNDGQRGYVWILPTSVRRDDDPDLRSQDAHPAGLPGAAPQVLGQASDDVRRWACARCFDSADRCDLEGASPEGDAGCQARAGLSR
jgi:hypothetical protein